MALIPTAVGSGLQVEVVSPTEQPTKTYYIDFEKKRLRGYVDRTAAMEQAIYKILMTDRFKHLIYSWNYGTEWDALQGKSWGVFESESKRIFKEALLADSRILGIRNYKATKLTKRTFAAEFIADTIFGEVAVRKEMSLNV